MSTQSKTQNPKSSKPASDAMQDGVEATLKSAADAGDYLKANAQALVESLTLTGKGLGALNAEISTYAKTSFEQGVATAQAVAGAKSLQEAVEIQANFAQSAMEAYLAGLSQWATLGSALMKDAAQPLNERTKANIEYLQGFAG
jgi:phasin family protein